MHNNYYYYTYFLNDSVCEVGIIAKQCLLGDKLKIICIFSISSTVSPLLYSYFMILFDAIDIHLYSQGGAKDIHLTQLQQQTMNEWVGWKWGIPLDCYFDAHCYSAIQKHFLIGYLDTKCYDK